MPGVGMSLVGLPPLVRRPVKGKCAALAIVQTSQFGKTLAGLDAD